MKLIFESSIKNLVPCDVTIRIKGAKIAHFGLHQFGQDHIFSRKPIIEFIFLILYRFLRILHINFSPLNHKGREQKWLCAMYSTWYTLL